MKIPPRANPPSVPPNRWSIASGVLRVGVCFVFAGLNVWFAANSPSHATQRLFMAGFWAVLGIGMLTRERHLYRTRMRRDRIDRGLCPRCGYDLRESQKRCPECGRLIPYAILMARKITLKPRELPSQTPAACEPRHLS